MAIWHCDGSERQNATKVDGVALTFATRGTDWFAQNKESLVRERADGQRRLERLRSDVTRSPASEAPAPEAGALNEVFRFNGQVLLTWSQV